MLRVDKRLLLVPASHKEITARYLENQRRSEEVIHLCVLDGAMMLSMVIRCMMDNGDYIREVASGKVRR
jgi:hypothetical protein